MDRKGLSTQIARQGVRGHVGMITISSSSFTVTRRPLIAPVQPTVSNGQRGANFSLASGIEGVGTVVLNGAAGDSGAGWNVGFLQAQWIETNWLAYRGLTQADGSVFVQRARPPARPRQGCFDCLVAGAPFYGTGANPATLVPATGGPALPFVAPLPASPGFPLTISAVHADFPGDFAPFSRRNGHTKKMNFLSEVQLEFHFCISLVVREPGGQLHFLQNLYWNVHWQNKFAFANAAANPAVTVVAAGTAANVGHVIAGRISDARFATVLTTPQTTNCNAIASTAEQRPNLTETAGWPLFNVTR